VTNGAPASYTSTMKPVHAGLVLVVLVSVAGITALPAGSAVHPRVTRAQAVERLGRTGRTAFP